ncbi:hypothetical protein D9615_004265 [Tricholomella constricta]|uniref:C2H2-type domain-containing protein n=1 Tax=Tricholomella constricta TaxID=117010 RepID=A0A8H5HF75_9AGAR|nr:hypothetical protein D9615_004265 [Tricholomella constricta]
MDWDLVTHQCRRDEAYAFYHETAPSVEVHLTAPLIQANAYAADCATALNNELSYSNGTVLLSPGFAAISSADVHTDGVQDYKHLAEQHRADGNLHGFDLREDNYKSILFKHTAPRLNRNPLSPHRGPPLDLGELPLPLPHSMSASSTPFSPNDEDAENVENESILIALQKPPSSLTAWKGEPKPVGTLSTHKAARMRRKPNREAPHSCKYCFKTFTVKRNWKYHMSSHFGIKGYECGSCQTRLATHANARRHAKAMHPDSFKC